jgi:ATP-dependent Lhr-like helicase
MDRLRQLIRERFRGFTEVQKKAMPLVEKGKNVLIIAPVGSGKTEAAILPILEKMTAYDKDGIQTLYITPLRALNRDMLERIGWWCRELGISLSVRHGDTSAYERAKQSRKPSRLFITTPETLQAMLAGKRIGASLGNVRHVIVDEIHELIDNKRGAQLSIGLERLEERAHFQRIGLSATIGDPKGAARFLCGKRDCEIVDVRMLREMDISIECPQEKTEHVKMGGGLFLDGKAVARLMRVKELVEREKSLVFLNTRQVAEALSSRLLALKAPIAVHHGSLSMEARMSAEEKFKKSEINGLLCTSSLELGIDIGDIELTIQYMSPKQVTRLVQRVGRSGHRIGKTPKGIIIAGDREDFLEAVAISALLKEGKLERSTIEMGALDVIAHQLAGMVLEEGRVTLGRAHDVMSRATSYDITRDELEKIAEQLGTEGVLFFDRREGVLKKTLNTRTYYYLHISTIPSERKFRVKNVPMGSFVGSLDERFVSALEIGGGFITKGIPWRVIDIDEENGEVSVEQTDDISFGIPDWSGDEIPVPFLVAQKVGVMRREISEGIWEKITKEVRCKAEIPNQQPLPDDRNVVVECCGGIAVLHACFGSLVNATLGRALSFLLSEKFGSSTRTVTDPYRIMIELPRPMKAEEVRELFLGITNLRGLIERSLTNSSLFRFKFNHVGRLFGLLEENGRASERLVSLLSGTPVYRETMRTVLRSYMDTDEANDLLDEMRSGKLSVHAINTKKLTPLSLEGISKVSGSELISPIEPKSEISRAFKAHSMKKNIKFQCTYCSRFFYHILEKCPNRIKCTHCGSPLVAVVGELIGGKTKRAIENADEKTQAASLVEAYGKRAVIALSIYGVGTKTATRILKRIRKDDDLLFADLLEAQRQFIRTKKYWKI